MNKNLKRTPSADTVSCVYRGHFVECSKYDLADGKCVSFGWNPAIEIKRKEMLNNGGDKDERL